MDLVIKNVSKSFKKKQALKNVSLSLHSGILGLLGPNGAGKSTLMRLITTIDTPSSGMILYGGSDISKNPNVIRQNLGYLPQDFGVYPNMTAYEFLSYMAAMKGIDRQTAKNKVHELLEALNLSGSYKVLLGGYSGGMKQRVGIAQALLSDPQILVVDEPTVGLDPEERIRFRNLLTSLSDKKIIILSTHIVSDVESIAPQIAILSSGTLTMMDSSENIVNSAENSIWKCIVSNSDLLELKKRYSVINMILRSDGIHVRFISRGKPERIATISSPTIVSPTLEDAYLFYTTQTGEAI
jgi:ABC-type multidrug transport system ATPase subunit